MLQKIIKWQLFFLSIKFHRNFLLFSNKKNLAKTSSDYCESQEIFKEKNNLKLIMENERNGGIFNNFIPITGKFVFFYVIRFIFSMKKKIILRITFYSREKYVFCP